MGLTKEESKNCFENPGGKTQRDQSGGTKKDQVIYKRGQQAGDLNDRRTTGETSRPG